MGLSPSEIRAMSLGEWIAVVSGWNRAHAGKNTVSAPSDDEFFEAVTAARRLN